MREQAKSSRRKESQQQQYAVVECSARTFRPKAFWDADSGRFVLAEPIILRNLKQQKNYWTLTDDRSTPGDHLFDERTLRTRKNKSPAKRYNQSKKRSSSNAPYGYGRPHPRHYSAASSGRERHMSSCRPTSLDSGMRQQTRSINVAATVRKAPRAESQSKNSNQPPTRKAKTPQANENVAKPPSRPRSNSVCRNQSSNPRTGKGGIKAIRHPRSDSPTRKVPCSRTSSCTSRLLPRVASATSNVTERPTSNSARKRGLRTSTSITNNSTGIPRSESAGGSLRKSLKANARHGKKDKLASPTVSSTNMRRAQCTPREAIKLLQGLQATKSVCSLQKPQRSSSVASKKRQVSQPVKSSTNLQKASRSSSAANKKGQAKPTAVPSNWRLLLPCCMSVKKGADRSKRPATSPVYAPRSPHRTREDKTSLRSPTQLCVEGKKSRALLKILRDGSHSVPTLVVTLPPPLSKPNTPAQSAASGKRRPASKRDAAAPKQCSSKTSMAPRRRGKNASTQRNSSSHTIRSGTRKGPKPRNNLL